MKADNELGEESKPYKRELAVVQRINVAWKLDESGTAVTPGVTSATVAAQGSATSAGAGSSAVADDVMARFTEVARTALRNSKGELPPVIAKVLESMRIRSNIPTDVANRVVESVRAEFSEPKAWSDYRDMVVAFKLDGVITDEEQSQLLELQASLGLADGVVQRLEKEADVALKSQMPPSDTPPSAPSTPA